jgi:hypothetical protein
MNAIIERLTAACPRDRHDAYGLVIDTPNAARISPAYCTGAVSLLAGNFTLRFFDAIGATEIDSDTICNKPGHPALHLIFGDSLRGIDPRIASG